jgi:predicted DNA-binding protein (UPF0251 family)
MSPRAKKYRLVQKAPNFSGFKPFGVQKVNDSEISLNFEEYEAIKFCDYELLTHAEASVLMNVSRPTFTRVYESARRKIAKAFVEASTICFEGGKVVFDMLWHKCNRCSITFTIPEGQSGKCPVCHQTENLVNI